MFLLKALIIPKNKRFPPPSFGSATANYLYVLKFIIVFVSKLKIILNDNFSILNKLKYLTISYLN